MTNDLPLYPDARLRTGLQFADVEKYRTMDSSKVWDRSDKIIEGMEGATNVAEARQAATELSKETLLRIHATIFQERTGAGQFRQKSVLPLSRGHDCPDPQFIERSLDNFFIWITAESFAEIHPIERAAFILTRVVDIWPFEFGNLTTAIVFANVSLRQCGFSPFFVLPEHRSEFNGIIAQAMTIETQPLVNSIHRTIKREMEAIAT